MFSNKIEIVRFASKGTDGFYDAVSTRVKAYFIENGISPYANAEMWIKTVVMVLLYVAPYLLMVVGLFAGNVWLFLGLWLLMAAGMSGIGTAVMHDANHGTYSRHKSVNRFLSRILDVIGGNTATWRIQHNVLHHTYTNVTGLDEDIDSIPLLRFSPNQRRYWFHRYQHIYTWLFYMLMTLFWMTAKDYFQLIRYQRFNLLVKEGTTLPKALIRATGYKLFYYGYIIVLPLLFSGMPWFTVITGFLIMHLAAGLFLSCVFQPAHVMEESVYGLPVEDRGKKKMSLSWAVHEISNTTNFSPRSRILSWFIGGLNFQIEHHLFANICHVHYRNLAPIVQETAVAFGLPYHVQPNFLRALGRHAKMLKLLGRPH